jgi:hypothetical protein
MESYGGMILTGKTEELGGKPTQCHFDHYKSHFLYLVIAEMKFLVKYILL